MSNPVKYMMDHKEIILEAYSRSTGPAKSWSFLCQRLSDIESVMKFNTFKQYYRAFVLIIKEYEERENNISGWTVSKGKDGYYRGSKRVKGRLVSLYISEKNMTKNCFAKRYRKNRIV